MELFVEDHGEAFLYRDNKVDPTTNQPTNYSQMHYPKTVNHFAPILPQMETSLHILHNTFRTFHCSLVAYLNSFESLLNALDQSSRTVLSRDNTINESWKTALQRLQKAVNDIAQREFLESETNSNVYAEIPTNLDRKTETEHSELVCEMQTLFQRRLTAFHSIQQHVADTLSKISLDCYQNPVNAQSFGRYQYGNPDREKDTPLIFTWGRPPSYGISVPILCPRKADILPDQQIAQIACGGNQILYLTSTGDLYTNGEDDSRNYDSDSRNGALRLIQELTLQKALNGTVIRFISCGVSHCLGITNLGEVYTWGSGEDGRLGHGDMRDRATPRKVMSLLYHRILRASCGGAHTAVLTDQNRVFAFGRGRNGRLGLGDSKCRDVPEEIATFSRERVLITNVICGWNFTIAKSFQNRVYSWGKQSEGQCGLGYTDQDQLVPCLIEKLIDYDVMEIACGYTHCIALTIDRKLFSWGLGEYGQLGRGIVYQPIPEIIYLEESMPDNDELSQIYCGAFHSIAMTKKNVMFAWGLNAYGACGLGHSINKDLPERSDFFTKYDTNFSFSCGHKYTLALQVSDSVVYQALSQKMTQVVQSEMESSPNPSIFPPFSFSPSSLLTYLDSNSLCSTDRKFMCEREQELRRSQKIWRTKILRNWNQARNSSSTRALWRQGIPPSLRARVWPLAIGNLLKITPTMYQLYRDRALHHEQGNAQDLMREQTLTMIDTDLPRTFPSLKLFNSSGPYYVNLLEILEVYACYRPDLGYIQGMSYLAAMIYLHIPTDTYLAFQCLANLMTQHHLFHFYLLDPQLSNIYYHLFEDFLQLRIPKLLQRFKELDVSVAMYMMNWLQTLFFQVLPLEIAARVFDNFLLDGTVFLFRTAMAIHEIFLHELLQAHQLEDILPLLQRSATAAHVWDRKITESDLFHTIANVMVPANILEKMNEMNEDAFFYCKQASSGFDVIDQLESR